MSDSDERHKTPGDAYVHGTSPDEQQRLSLLNDLLNDACLRELNLHGTERIIDFGSGLGQFSRAMARVVAPQGRVLAIEQSAEQLQEAGRQAREAGEGNLIEMRRGDVYQPPLGGEEWASFDLAHCRFLLEHIRNPLDIVRHMVRAVRSGGRIVLADDDHYLLRLWPEPAGFAAIWHAYIRSYELNGNDGYIGRRLVWLLHAAGAQPHRNSWVFFGSCRGDPNFESFVENLAGVVMGARELVVTAGLIEATDFDKGLDSLQAWSEHADAAIWYGICWAEGLKK